MYSMVSKETSALKSLMTLPKKASSKLNKPADAASISPEIVESDLQPVFDFLNTNLAQLNEFLEDTVCQEIVVRFWEQVNWDVQEVLTGGEVEGGEMKRKQLDWKRLEYAEVMIEVNGFISGKGVR